MPRVLGPVVPAGPFYGMQDVYLRGGLRVVSNTSERDALPVSLRYPGMLALTRDNGALWRLNDDLSNWTWVGNGGRRVLNWSEQVSIDPLGGTIQEIALGGDTTFNLNDSTPTGVFALLFIINDQATSVALSWNGATWPRGVLASLAPYEQAVVRLFRAAAGIVAEYWRQGVFQPILPARDKLVSYWTLDRQVAGTYEDLVGNKPMSANGFQACAGLVNRGAMQTAQDGTTSTLMRVSDAAFQLSTSGGFALRLWFRVPGTIPERLITWADNNAQLNTGDLRVYHSNGNLRAVLFNDSGHEVYLPFTPDRWWHRLVITWSPDEHKLTMHLDAASASVTGVLTSGATGSLALNLGTITASGVPGTCFDEVAYWKGYSLTQEEVEDDWAGGAASGTAARPPAGGDTGPTAINFEHLLDGAPVW